MNGCQGQGMGWVLTTKGQKGTLEDDANGLKLDCGDGMQLYEFI